MRSPEDMVGLALEAAEDALRAGDLPIGAVVLMGDEMLGRAHTSERSQGRRVVHADLLAMEEADRRLGWGPRPAPLVLAITLEPCLMCLGAAMVLGVAQIYYGLEAPDDGAAGVPAVWRPARQTMPFAKFPAISGGHLREACREPFARFAATAPEGGMRRYAEEMSALPPP